MAAKHVEISGLYPASYGASGRKRHVASVRYYIENEGKPWARKVVVSARPVCNRYSGFARCHSIDWDHPINIFTKEHMEHITCEVCKS